MARPSTCTRCGGPHPRSYGWCAGCTDAAARSSAVDQGLEPTVGDPVVLRRLATAVRRVLSPAERRAS